MSFEFSPAGQRRVVNPTTATSKPISPCERCEAFCAIAEKDMGIDDMLLDIEDGKEGDEFNIGDDDEEVGPVRVAVDLGKPTER